MLCSASTVPCSVELVPKVAELPICQKTLQADPPLIITTELELAVVNVDPALKIKTALASPPAFNVRVPVRPMLEAEV
jgi:hypothetical protein